MATSLPMLLMLALVACAQAEPVPPGGSASCVVSDAPQVLNDAVCAASADRLQGALSKLKDTDESPNFVDVIPVLERLWSRDRTMGQGLPWEKLEDLNFRAVLARHMAQQVRVGRSRLPLRDMQELAIKLSRRDLADGGYEGILLIGLTHTPGQVGFLREVLTASSDPGQRTAAISSLGMVCDAEAAAALTALQTSPKTSEREKKSISQAEISRSRLSERTCRLARGER